MSWKDSLERRDEVRQAFIDGYLTALADDANPYTPLVANKMAQEAWLDSDARKRLQKPLAS